MVRPAPNSLRWESGTRAKAEGKDFAGVIGRLSDSALAWWYRRLTKRPLYHELRIMEAELDRRRISRSPKDVDGQRLLFTQEKCDG